jgi:hypothetical protein
VSLIEKLPDPFVRGIGLERPATKTEMIAYLRSAEAYAEYERALGRDMGESPALKALRKKYLGSRGMG